MGCRHALASTILCRHYMQHHTDPRTMECWLCMLSKPNTSNTQSINIQSAVRILNVYWISKIQITNNDGRAIQYIIFKSISKGTWDFAKWLDFHKKLLKPHHFISLFNIKYDISLLIPKQGNVSQKMNTRTQNTQCWYFVTRLYETCHFKRYFDVEVTFLTMFPHCFR